VGSQSGLLATHSESLLVFSCFSSAFNGASLFGACVPTNLGSFLLVSISVRPSLAETSPHLSSCIVVSGGLSYNLQALLFWPLLALRFSPVPMQAFGSFFWNAVTLCPVYLAFSILYERRGDRDTGFKPGFSGRLAFWQVCLLAF
jgi:hypothetical protein